MVEVMGSRVVMEMGEKMAEKGVGKKGGKHCAVHSVLNREGDRVNVEEFVQQSSYFESSHSSACRISIMRGITGESSVASTA
nr:hypothetical protein [Tanacetum cinerariifolium]